MLGALAAKRAGLKPTRLMYAANLSHGQMKGYLEELEERGFVVRMTTKDGEVLQISDPGAQFLTAIRQMQEFEKGWGF